MAFIEESEDTGTGGRFVRIIQGSLCLKADTPLDDKYVVFNTKNPETDAPVSYYVKRFKRVLGTVDRLERVEIAASKLFGYNLHMTDDEGNFSVFFKDSSPLTDRLLKAFENIDLAEELEISVFKDSDDKAGISFKQGGANVPQKWWRKGEEGNLPAPKKVKGKWSYAESEEFLYNNAMENIIPQFAEKQAAVEANRAARAANASGGAPVEPELSGM